MASLQTSNIIMGRDQLISMLHFLEERGKESERENKEMKDLVKKLTETHKQNMKIQSNFMESIDKLTNQLAKLSDQN